MAFNVYSIVGSVLRCLEAEKSHALALWALRRGLVRSCPSPDDPRLALSLWGRTFPNPVGVAAGLDKNAEVSDALLRLGFGFVEVGGVTPRPQPGNARPRVFRLPEDQAMINRMGFNNEGSDVVSARLAKRDRSLAGLVGVNLGKNKDSPDAAADYEAGVKAFGALADFMVINVSSPNTPGLRALQGREPLQDIIRRTRGALTRFENPPPLLLKIAPDLTGEDEADIAAVAMAERLDGLVISNTTIARSETLRGQARAETGGLSGRPLFRPSTELLRRMWLLTGGSLPLVGVGGVSCGEDAYAKIRAGASLVQLYTALIYQGPALVKQIKRDLSALLRRDGFSTVVEAVGADHR